MWYDSRTATAVPRLPVAFSLPVALLLLAAVGCSGQDEPPATLPPQTMSPVASPPGGDEEVSAAAVPPTAKPQPQAPARAGRDEPEDTSIIVIDRGEASPKTPAGGEEEKQEQGEEYWRRRGLEIRMAWRDEVDSIEELEKEVFMLRQRFYAEDDPFYRDGQVKPAWDQALEQLEDARVGAKEREAELQEFLEEGRKAGALPGWMREGIELEPHPPDELEPGEQIQGHEPREPVVIEVQEGGAK